MFYESYFFTEQRRDDECVNLEARHVPDMYDCDDSDMEEIEQDDYAQFFESNSPYNAETPQEVQEFHQGQDQLPEQQNQTQQIPQKKVVQPTRKRSQKANVEKKKLVTIKKTKTNSEDGHASSGTRPARQRKKPAYLDNYEE